MGHQSENLPQSAPDNLTKDAPRSQTASLAKVAPFFRSNFRPHGMPSRETRLHELTDDQLAELRRFWMHPDRYQELRTAYRSLLTHLKSNPSAFYSQMETPKVTNSQLNLKALDRLKSLEKEPLKHDVRKLTTLLFECDRLRTLWKVDQLEQPFANLAQMATDFSNECQRYPSFSQAGNIANAHSSRRIYSINELEALDRRIVVRSTNDPKHPEFPHLAPHFPATPITRIKLADGRGVYVKDESHNPTGSHKDRWAWEKIVAYKRAIQPAMQSKTPLALPELSMISAGSAAVALQDLLRRFDLPSLRVIIDLERAGDRTRQGLTTMGCKVFPHDLDNEFLSQDDVLRITENTDGIDITSRDLLKPFAERFYDWMVYEILNKGPKHIFVPVGSGDLLANIISVLRDEKTKKGTDPRDYRGSGRLAPIGVYGITTSESRTLLDKLYAKFRPTHEELRKLIQAGIAEGVMLPQSRLVEHISEDRVRKAKDLADNFGIATEYSGIAGLALFMQMAREIPKSDRVIVVNTGRLHLPGS